MKKTALIIITVSAIVMTHGLGFAADIDAARAKATVCAACHGPKGVSTNPEWPNLAGQQDKYLAMQLKAYRNGSRKNNLMSPQAAGLSDADIDNLAAYFAGLPCK